MKRLLFCAAGLSFAWVFVAQPQTPAPGNQKDAEDYIRKSESEWAESVATGDVSVVERILADDFVGSIPRENVTTSRP